MKFLLVLFVLKGGVIVLMVQKSHTIKNISQNYKTM